MEERCSKDSQFSRMSFSLLNSIPYINSTCKVQTDLLHLETDPPNHWDTSMTSPGSGAAIATMLPVLSSLGNVRRSYLVSSMAALMIP